MNRPRSCLLSVAILLMCVSGCGPDVPAPESHPDAGPPATTLTWTPTIADCGYTTSGVATRQTITFSNPGADTVRITDLVVAPASDVRLLNDTGTEVTELTVPAAGTAELQVEFKPMNVGAQQATLTFHTDLPSQPSGTIVLRCYGGGPDIGVRPSPTLNFGKVATFPGTQAVTSRRVTVMNVGTQPRDGDLSGNLHITSVEVVPSGEFSVTLPESYDPAVGLTATVGGNAANLTVSMAAGTTVGVHEAELRIHSNDPDEPVVTVALKADVVQLSECQYTVNPEVVSVGVITPPDYRDLTFTVTNDGSDACILSGLRIADDSTLQLSMPEAPIDSVEIAPGETRSIAVRVWPPSSPPATPLSGRVLFDMSSPSKPEAAVLFTTQP